MLNQTPKTALVTDPYTGKVYDVLPLFRYLNESNMPHPSRLAAWCETMADQVPLLIEEDGGQVQHMQQAFETLVSLKRVFRAIEEK